MEKFEKEDEKKLAETARKGGAGTLTSPASLGPCLPAVLGLVDSNQDFSSLPPVSHEKMPSSATQARVTR